MTTILTGLRANGTLHLGNYLGAMLPMVGMQDKVLSDASMTLDMFVPDLHSFITPIDHTELQASIYDNVRMYMAAGITSDSSTALNSTTESAENDNIYDKPHSRINLYRQSKISAHAELTWILGCFAHMGELGRMTQFKDKSGSSEDSSIGLGLFSYPVLMAADILLYSAEYVPVGEDQRQHLELTRDLATRFNNKFGDIFTVPKTWDEQMKFAGTTSGAGSRIRSLKNPEKKMSKSVDDPSGTIMLSDTPEAATKKIMSATTDSFGEIQFDFTERPGISNLLIILSLLSGATLEETINKYKGQTLYGQLKGDVAEAVSKFLTNFQVKYNSVTQEQVSAVLEAGESRVAPVAFETLDKVKRAVGLL
jgi:tryptophanyl-tRNA synthetase